MTSILGIPLGEFIEVTEEVLARLLALDIYPNKADNGVFMAVRRTDSLQPLLVIRIGKQPNGPTKSFDLAQEKCTRLLEHMDDGHFTSGQSRNKAMERYAGAIMTPPNSQAGGRGHEIIGGASGLCEDGDEAMIAVIWAIFRWLVLGDLKAIVATQGNALISPLLRACNDLFDRPLPT